MGQCQFQSAGIQRGDDLSFLNFVTLVYADFGDFTSGAEAQLGFARGLDAAITIDSHGQVPAHYLDELLLGCCLPALAGGKRDQYENCHQETSNYSQFFHD